MKKRTHKKLLLALLMVCILLVGISVGTSLSFVAAPSDTVTNTFVPSKMSCKVLESFNNNVKTNVRVQNTGDGAAYIRVKLLPYWYAKDDGDSATNDNIIIGKTAWEIPAASFPTDTNWVKGSDGYYYYTKPVPVNDKTEILIHSVTLDWDSNVTSVRQVLEIIASCVQAEPSQAVIDAWGVSVGTDGTLSVPQNS